MKNLQISSKYHYAIFLGIFFLCILLLLGRLYKTKSAVGGDAVYYFSSLRSFVLDYDLSLENEFEYFHNQISPFTGNRKIPVTPNKDSKTGKMATKYPIGTAIFLIPPYLLIHFILKGDGYSLPYQTAAALGSLFYAFLGLLLMYNLGRKIFGHSLAFWGTLGIWLATPLIYYMTMEPLSSQSISFFCVSAFIFLWYKTRQNPKIYNWVILGLLGGLMSIVRYQDALFLIIPLADNLKNLNKKALSLILFGVFTLISATPQLIANNYHYGSPLNTGMYSNSGFPYLFSPQIFYTLFSFERGLFVWSPIVIFALIGLYWFIQKQKLFGFLLFSAFLLQVYIVSSWADPTQGDSFGNRILLNSNLIFGLGLMQFLKDTEKYKKIFLTIFALLVLINTALAGLFVFRIIGQSY